MKRLFDFCCAALGLVCLSPLFVLAAIAIRLDSPGPVFHRGLRAGKDGKQFRIFKFRTMAADAALHGPGLTRMHDPRITRLGKMLRRTKLDELPQLINVLAGQMSLVGPRPEDPRYLPYYAPRYQQVLSVLPGMTSIASIRYRNEAELLESEAWEQLYINTILPAKLDIELSYLLTRSAGQDLVILATTVFALLKDEASFDFWARLADDVERLLIRYGSWVTVDALLILAAHLLGIGLRSLNARVDFPIALAYALGGGAVYILFNYLFGIYRRFWRYASAQEVVVLFASAAAATLVTSGLDMLLQERVLPLGALWLGGFFTFVFMAIARYRMPLRAGVAHMVSGFAGLASGKGARVLVIGAGEEGQLLAWQLKNRFQGKAYQLVGFVDDKRDKHGMYIHGARVFGGRPLIPQLAASLHVDLIIIAIPALRVREPRELLALCRATPAQIKILPSLFAWLDRSSNSGTAPGWEDAGDHDFIQRTTYKVDEHACEALVGGRVVLVTGAAGSVGSELCRQLAGFGPARLVLVDSNESGLYDLSQELQAMFKTVPAELALCDITHATRMGALFARVRPQIVFHAAAYKHVHILEAHPAEAVRVNVGGTRVAHALSRAHGVERFILISTDKAVNPNNAYGMSKWLCELLVCAEPEASPMRSSIVRFGNVLGSRGSVIPTLERQIELGGPLTITHPDMTRYFLTIGEAVSLVIQAAAMTQGGDCYVLDMGVPIRIMDLAHRLVRMHGLRPGLDIAIEVTGLRQGEKLSEELVDAGEEQLKTSHPSVFRIQRNRPIDTGSLPAAIDELVSLAEGDQSAMLVYARLAQLVAALRTEPAPEARPLAATAPQSLLSST